MSSRPSPFILEFYAECKPVNSCKFAKLDEASCGQKKGKLYRTVKALILSITLTTERSQSIANRGLQRKVRETGARVTFGAKCINRKLNTHLSCRFEVYLAIENYLGGIHFGENTPLPLHIINGQISTKYRLKLRISSFFEER